MCGPKFCSMRITQDIRDYAEQNGLDTQEAIQTGMKQKAEDFKAAGSSIYA
ncbi:Phosphomethylpyrimidine synthase [compost metagenome]